MSTARGDDIVVEMLAQVIKEETDKLNGPECAPELHYKNTDMRIERRILYGPPTTRLDQTYGHCLLCERSVRRDDGFIGQSNGWTVTHGASCRCSTCPWKIKTP